MTDTTRTTEQRILIVMRKVLGSVVKDTTPSSPGLRHPLTEKTIEDIRQCFGLIAAREQELAKEAGIDIKERPRYADEPASSKVVSIDGLKKSAKKQDEDS
ncbi:MAG TPA: segregation and condensation protein A [Chromatiales bacterium]|nr:segregation and condensation protein A [Thiotrichales bacterium]HIP69472.1 segregation and condensation protein A [Chromatiales bacterium]